MLEHYREGRIMVNLWQEHQNPRDGTYDSIVGIAASWGRSPFILTPF